MFGYIAIFLLVIVFDVYIDCRQWKKLKQKEAPEIFTRAMKYVKCHNSTEGGQ